MTEIHPRFDTLESYFGEDATKKILKGEPVPLYLVRAVVTPDGGGGVVCEGLFGLKTEAARHDAHRLAELGREVAQKVVPPKAVEMVILLNSFLPPGAEADLFRIILSLGMADDGRSVWYPHAAIYFGLEGLVGMKEAIKTVMDALMAEVCSW